MSGRGNLKNCKILKGPEIFPQVIERKLFLFKIVMPRFP